MPILINRDKRGNEKQVPIFLLIVSRLKKLLLMEFYSQSQKKSHLALREAKQVTFGKLISLNK